MVCRSSFPRTMCPILHACSTGGILAALQLSLSRIEIIIGEREVKDSFVLQARKRGESQNKARMIPSTSLHVKPLTALSGIDQ